MNEGAARTAFFKALMGTDVRRGNGKQEDAELEAALTAAFAVLDEPIHDQVVEGTHVTVEYDDEPVYEYRVVCVGPWGPRPFGWPRGSYDGAVWMVKSLETTHHASHDHTIERRAVGPWEAT